ncbi:MAG: hydantoinase/oxoprolinase family protein [Candidatus Eremiobacteraeota bacterium]|nr:hydantoinase/oxoprolinase family protein [Candidatus Eremiobacteraeota bacterium]
MSNASYRAGIDVGGTFTDLLAEDTNGAIVAIKVPTTPRAPQDGVLAAVRQFQERAPGAHITLLAHSTTIATNALLGQMHLELPRVALITTEGFRDVIEIGRQNRSEIYNLFVTRPKPLVARNDRLCVAERLDFNGNVLVPLDPDSLNEAIEYVRANNIPAVAIGFLHSYINDAHERAAAHALARALPHVAIAQSAELDPEYREYERFSTAVVNAALLPVISTYLEALMRGLSGMGIDAPLYVMQSNGGMSRADRVLARPATIIESGPASGVIAAAHAGRRRNISHVLSFDMGGTTAKAGTIVDGRPQVVAEFEAAGRTHSGRAMKGSGYPVRFPFIDLAEVSAGGGTIAWIDDGGALRVGPLSAGADPGPACYGVSDRATVSDANVVLGRLNQSALLGGAFPIDAQRSRDAVEKLARPLGLGIEETAAGIVKLVDTEMSKVLRIVTVERGLDPRDFALVAFGGNGALHACALADELGIHVIVIPPRSGLFSAYGLLVAELQASHTRPLLTDAGAFKDEQANDIFATLERTAREELLAQGAPASSVTFAREYDARYAGQSFELAIAADGSVAQSAARFHERHEATYGYAVPHERVELVNARLNARAPVAPLSRSQRSAEVSKRVPAQRPVWFADGARDLMVFQRSALTEGQRLRGPAIIEQYDACTYAAPGWDARLDAGDLVLERATA